jgi:hypothetical protein
MIIGIVCVGLIARLVIGVCVDDHHRRVAPTGQSKAALAEEAIRQAAMPNEERAAEKTAAALPRGRSLGGLEWRSLEHWLVMSREAK